VRRFFVLRPESPALVAGLFYCRFLVRCEQRGEGALGDVAVRLFEGLGEGVGAQVGVFHCALGGIGTATFGAIILYALLDRAKAD
jgi:hypothetical protein